MQENGLFDILIVGGGPGGLSALQWCAELGLTAILLEKETEFGGQLLQTHNPITNYLGTTARNGRELRDAFLDRLADKGVIRLSGAEIVEADLSSLSVHLNDGTAYSGRAIIIATGIRRRELGIPGEREFRGRGILESGAKERNEVADKHVVIVGGGDAALENAVILAERAARVSVVHRRKAFTARRDFVERASRNPKVALITETRMVSIHGNSKVESVRLEKFGSGEQSTLETDAVLIRIGVLPNSGIIRGQIELDRAGYAVIDRNCATNMPNVFAIGDVANPNTPTIAAAVGQGSIAVKTISNVLRECVDDRA